MNRLILDVEATINEDGSPFHSSNKLCCVGLYSPDLGTRLCIPIEYDNRPYGNQLSAIKELIESADLIIGFNLKYDINWIRKYIPDIVFPDIWDCQLAEFLLAAQRRPYPSLNETAIRYEVGEKIANVLEEYWDKGIDTTAIPWEILEKYNLNDLDITFKVYEKQTKLLQGNQLKLFQLQCADLLILSEMECNGLLIDTDILHRRSKELDIQIKELYNQLNAIVGRDDINWDSPTQVSIILYGGVLQIPCKEQVTRVLKSGKIKTYERMGIQEVECVRRVEPLSGTEGSRTRNFDEEGSLERENEARVQLGKTRLQRVYETNEPTLRALRPRDSDTRRIIQSLLNLSELSQLQSTYYRGLLRRIAENNAIGERMVEIRESSESKTSNGSSPTGRPNRNESPDQRHGVSENGEYERCNSDTSAYGKCNRSGGCQLTSLEGNGTYLGGKFTGPKTAIIHGQFNQCVAVTGRLSSSKPNLQNMADDVLEAIKTRYVN